MLGLIFLLASTPLLTRSYTLQSYQSLVNGLFAAKATCPHMTLDTAHARYGTPRPCDGCEQYIVTLSAAGPDAPQVFISGALHGDEKLGPNIALELIRFLCSDQGEWSQSLLKKTRIVVVPIGNPQGYINDWREERIGNIRVDPNRDFPYETSDCMLSSTARCIQELFSEHLFTLSITFHGGDNALGYMWGSPNHAHNSKSTEAPDAFAASRIAKVLKDYSKADVKVGPITDTVYWVRGGLEDYAYAASWENSVNRELPIKNCTATTYEPYSLTSINRFSFSQIMYLVETHPDKHPPDSLLGAPEQILQGDGGLIPQYVRLSLALIDFAQPEIQAHWRVDSEETVRVEWHVAGCLRVNSTWVEVSQGEARWNTTALSGDCTWGNHSVFSEVLRKSADLEFKVFAVVDQDWSHQVHPDPNVKPQSLFVQARTIPDFQVSNKVYTLRYNGQVNTTSMKAYVTF